MHLTKDEVYFILKNHYYLGGRIKSPTPCDSLSILRPICIAGGEQTLFVVTPDGKLYANGYDNHVEIITSLMSVYE